MSRNGRTRRNKKRQAKLDQKGINQQRRDGGMAARCRPCMKPAVPPAEIHAQQ